MKISKRYRPELLVSKGKEPNPTLSDPYLDAKEDRLVATNGHAMVALPVETEKGERSRYLACSLLVAGRKLGEDDQPAEIVGEEVTEFGVLWPAAQERQFIDWQKVVQGAPRRGDPGTASIALNARLLKALAESMGSPGGVVLTFALERGDAAGAPPILVTPVLDGEEFGLLMPLSSEEEDDVDPDQRCAVPSCRRLLAAGAKCPDHPEGRLEPVLDALADLGRSKDGTRVSVSVNGGEEHDLTAFAEKRDAEKRAKRSGGDVPPLEFARSPHDLNVQKASVAGGTYWLTFDRSCAFWTAEWEPTKGKPKKLAVRKPEQECKAACAAHHLEHAADEYLPDEMKKADLKGDAVAVKRKGGCR